MAKEKTTPDAPKRPFGRPLTQNSARMSESMFKRHYGIGCKPQTLQAIADAYNQDARRIERNKRLVKEGLRPQTFTAAAVHYRVKNFQEKINPELAKELLGSVAVKEKAPKPAQALPVGQDAEVTVLSEEGQPVAVLTENSGSLVTA